VCVCVCVCVCVYGYCSRTEKNILNSHPGAYARHTCLIFFLASLRSLSHSITRSLSLSLSLSFCLSLSLSLAGNLASESDFSKGFFSGDASRFRRLCTLTGLAPAFGGDAKGGGERGGENETQLGQRRGPLLSSLCSSLVFLFFKFFLFGFVHGIWEAGDRGELSASGGAQRHFFGGGGGGTPLLVSTGNHDVGLGWRCVCLSLSLSLSFSLLSLYGVCGTCGYVHASVRACARSRVHTLLISHVNNNFLCK